MANNTVAILRRQRALLDRAIRALEECQELAFAVPQDSKDAAARQATAKALHLYKGVDQEEPGQPSPLPPGNEPGNA